VFFFGKITSLFRRVYDIVAEAQSRAIKKIKPGISISEIDAASRRFIAQKGYGNFFGHNLGHGIGRQIHEEPHISAHEDTRLEAGMVFTVEPGIYLTGQFGVRLEDMVLVTQKEAEVLSGALHK
ncbi:MAG: M24 family metallopeptidase, partial [Candidatus Omnitrophica bacterium]|nr:M24 family metallopeptidase [Candidatus Omnitrophota bacterium]